MCGVTFGSIAIKLAIALYALEILDNNVVLAQTKGQALVPHKPGDTQRTVFVPPSSTCEPPRQNCDLNNKFFYTFDGSCNNLNKTFWGQAGTVYQRMFPANYADSKRQICVSAVDGSALPNVRDVRRLLLSDMSDPDRVHNINFYAAGQYYTHDVTSFNSARLTSSCCTADNKPVVPTPPGCIPVLVRPDDPWYSQFGVRCLPMTRANCSYDAKCDMDKPSTPLNFVTGVMDMSMMYSNNKNISDTLRTMKGGRMKKWMNSFNQMFFPMTTACSGISSDCWVCADQRVTACPELCLLTLLFFRLHDTLCSVFANVANYLNDQQTFDCVRRLVIACAQMTLYKEYLPFLLGIDACTRHNLLPLRSGYTTYNSSMNPGTCVEYTIVSRSGHDNVVPSVSYRATDGSMTSYQLRKKFSNQTFLMEGTTYPHLMQSYHVTSCNKADSHGIHDLDDCLFPDPGEEWGLDLAAADLQRARDMGMPGYCALRRYLNLSPVKSFDDLRGIIDKPEDIPKLRQLYKCVEDIDALLMIRREARTDPVATVGPVGAGILCKAYQAYKFGDRLYFEHGGPTAICPEALQIIRRTRMCHLICWANPTISDMLVPENWYGVPSRSNQMKSCAEWIRSGPDMARLARLMAQQAYPEKSAPPRNNRP